MWSPYTGYGYVFLANPLLTTTTSIPQTLDLVRTLMISKPSLNLSILNFLLFITANFSKQLNLRFQDSELHESLSSFQNFFIFSGGKSPSAYLPLTIQDPRAHSVQSRHLEIDAIHIQEPTTIVIEITGFLSLALNVSSLALFNLPLCYFK